MIEINSDFKRALALMENSAQNVFITGRAGTGKSTLLKLFRGTTKKKIIVLAPTGVAAVNVEGQTIHSFFGFKPDITIRKAKTLKPLKAKIYKKIDVIVIDEISMVRADLLDCVDVFMRKHGKDKTLPFGGVRMVFIGDLYQLPPVVGSQDREAFKELYESPYFFASRAADLGGFTFTMVELEKVYRQSDPNFIDLLNVIRNNTSQPEDLKYLNTRFDSDFPIKSEGYITLTAKNDRAETVNTECLNALDGKVYYSEAKCAGKFENSGMPTSMDLYFKIGAQVMLLNNDSAKRWINGSIGKVQLVEVSEGTGEMTVWVTLEDGKLVEVTPHSWELFKFSYNSKKASIDSEVVGSFRQLPFRLAWAVTIHKAQGKTFDKVIVDIGSGTFTPGQLYVALSRCTSLEGLVVKQRITARNIFIDWSVVNFMTKYRYNESEAILPLEDKITMIKEAITQKLKLKITYLKSDDTKLIREIIPTNIGEKEFKGKLFLGLTCSKNEQERVFRVDRMLNIEFGSEV